MSSFLPENRCTLSGSTQFVVLLPENRCTLSGSTRFVVLLSENRCTLCPEALMSALAVLLTGKPLHTFPEALYCSRRVSNDTRMRSAVRSRPSFSFSRLQEFATVL